MAKKDSKTPKAPGQFRQLWRVYVMTAKGDKTSVLWASLGFTLSVLAAVTVSALTAPGNVTNLVLFTVSGVLTGILVAMIVMSRKAERVAYMQIEGQQGAVGAVLANGLRRSWRGSEMPVAINGKTRDAVYRAIGPGGIVLVGEGPKSRVQALVEDERKKISRIAPGAPVQVLYVGTDDNSVRIYALKSALYKMKKALTRAEISVVDKRLSSLGMNIPIPKGMDPAKIRASRK
ncbi:MAG: hypothetical protein RIS82_227 [Actinomycetota bacterium]|jgi:hypothetical protein